jgi:hypothetical protein
MLSSQEMEEKLNLKAINIRHAFPFKMYGSVGNSVKPEKNL